MMENHTINVFIVDDNLLLLANLKQFLEDKFKNSVQISTFVDAESCLKKINQVTHFVILDCLVEGKEDLEIIKLIKDKNPKTEVIVLSNNENIALVIETFRSGAKDYVIKGKDSMPAIYRLITQIVTAPIRILVKEFGVSKFMAIFLMTFITIGIIVALALYFW